MHVANRPPKKDAFDAFVKEGWVWVHFDARKAGVEVPEGFGDNPRLVLQYGYDMPVPIPDLTVDEDGIRATLSFQRVPCPTFVPWSAVYILACTDGRGVVYVEDVPKEVVLQVQGGAEAPSTEGRAQGGTDATQAAEAAAAASQPIAASERVEASRHRSAGRGRPALAMVPLSEADPEADADVVVPARVRRPRLRLVK